MKKLRPTIISIAKRSINDEYFQLYLERDKKETWTWISELFQVVYYFGSSYIKIIKKLTKGYLINNKSKCSKPHNNGHFSNIQGNEYLPKSIKYCF